MRLTIVGSGDAFGSGGRRHTCFFAETAAGRWLVDCGATAVPGLAACGVGSDDVDGIVLSHLHGDHFGGLPFLLLDCLFVARRARPLTIVGPPGTRARLAAALEVFYPGFDAVTWSFERRVVEIAVGRPTALDGLGVVTTEVDHPSGAPSTALRLDDGRRVLAYSGDTAWTDALVGVAAGADLFVTECCGYDRSTPTHLDWATLRPQLPRLAARRVMLTHMGPAMLARADEARAAGVLVAEDGLVMEV